MPTLQAQRKAFQYIVDHTPKPGMRGDYRGRAMHRWLSRIRLDVDGCWLWQGSYGGAGAMPAFQYSVGGRYRKRSAIWFLLEHWFPAEYSRYTAAQRKTRAACGKRWCVSPLCRKSLVAQDYRMSSRKLDADRVRDILAEPWSDSDELVAEKYGVSSRMIHYIRSGRAWTEVPGERRPKRKATRRLTPDEVWSILCAKDTITRRELAEKFGVSSACIASIWKGTKHPQVYRAYMEGQAWDSRA